jgi:hypothetical protein
MTEEPIFSCGCEWLKCFDYSAGVEGGLFLMITRII